ncbi:FCD domain-containing protein [Streptomyces sp. 3MP-14]|uniref:FCD domain-containing protein n=1 Tax=Streptomyces mimosae TaxID=2586635 RepID=A0A5N6AEU3_9ACTN|nr:MULTISPECIES: FadR/GntR family transcriptional regulator [Streptomyces]KAB8166330.1 FCD domain-containing protein [Streptomyces mimosae]KAB8174123.1 FCD domain-containing protein [Streptomyces sp. 3MP-14]
MGLIDEAVDRLKEMLITGELGPGDRLPVEKDLAARLGVSRGTLREAVRTLSAMRVLSTRQGDGTYVTSLAPDMLLAAMGFVVDLHQDATVLQFFQVRRMLEPQAVALAAHRISEETLEELEQLLVDAEELVRQPEVDHTALVENDLRFHALVNEASGNPVLAAVVEGMSGGTTRARIWRGKTDAGAAERTVGEHRAILTALRARDADRARLRAETHIVEVEDWLIEHLSGGSPH